MINVQSNCNPTHVFPPSILQIGKWKPGFFPNYPRMKISEVEKIKLDLQIFYRQVDGNVDNRRRREKSPPYINEKNSKSKPTTVPPTNTECKVVASCMARRANEGLEVIFIWLWKLVSGAINICSERSKQFCSWLRWRKDNVIVYVIFHILLKWKYHSVSSSIMELLRTQSLGFFFPKRLKNTANTFLEVLVVLIFFLPISSEENHSPHVIVQVAHSGHRP